jgi:hypothetical protein
MARYVIRNETQCFIVPADDEIEVLAIARRHGFKGGFSETTKIDKDLTEEDKKG